MKKVILIIVGCTIFMVSGCRYCDDAKTSDAIVATFSTNLPTDTFQIGQSIPFYLKSNIWPSLNYDSEYTAQHGSLSFSVLVFTVTDTGVGVNAAYLFNCNSQIATVTPKISGATSLVSKFKVDLDVSEETYPFHPAFELTPTNTGRFGISFQLGSTGIIEAPGGKKNTCDVLVDMYGSFTSNEIPNPVLDQSGVVYQENITLPGGTPHPIVRVYGFYVKP